MRIFAYAQKKFQGRLHEKFEPLGSGTGAFRGGGGEFHFSPILRCCVNIFLPQIGAIN